MKYIEAYQDFLNEAYGINNDVTLFAERIKSFIDFIIERYEIKVNPKHYYLIDIDYKRNIVNTYMGNYDTEVHNIYETFNLEDKLELIDPFKYISKFSIYLLCEDLKSANVRN